MKVREGFDFVKDFKNLESTVLCISLDYLTLEKKERLIFLFVFFQLTLS